jgi:phosphoglycolate phosphatase
MTELVRALHEQRVPLGLATSKPCGTAFRQLAGIGLLNLFSARGCAAEDESRGSKIEVMSDAIKGLSHLSLGTSEIVMIGDRIHDFEASRELGVTCVAVRWGYGNPDEWAQADHQVGTPEELSAFCHDNVSELLIAVD